MPSSTRLSRRTLLTGGLAVSAAGLLVPAGSAAAGALTGTSTGAPGRAAARFRELEDAHAARLGVYARNHRTGRSLAHRADERFAFCSTIKVLLSSHVLRDRPAAFLDRVITYTKADLVPNSPITEQHVAEGMAVRDICAAALDYSDNTAANLLFRETGGPAAVTRFARSIGDPRTRSDRTETSLNTAIPGDPRDTTTPRAYGHDLTRLVLGDALDACDRAQLTTWMKANTTSAKRFHAGLPDDWTIADKTGTGDYGVDNDAGVVWTSAGTPLTIVVYSTKHEQDAAPDDALVAAAARTVARTLAPGE